MPSDRIPTLADAAIDLLADAGMRGLTHRAVDVRAGMPQGTTSAYLRTRQALVEAVVNRLADLDRRDLEATPLPDAIVDMTDLDAIATGIAYLLDRWLTTDRRRTLARYHCVLAATHQPELRTVLAHGAASRTQARAMMAAAGATDPDRAGDHLVASIDGLLFDRLAGAGALTAPPAGTEEGRADLTVAVRALLTAYSTA
ncbi:TetR/AcrR family transcriptional regulator [Virgisporangium ochraceum]|uniref:HTH tetR-type domain-containing protein n=1 Tax=Virgisporangium ochraceum TaxID=65505 RepID=A0A8J4EA60_9ACTN|nr:TetR/AcrR family transcriptional regulator [Virgisporangium ochraceum]GIJ67179.1 hypothetical protein Voc01_020960 [Virgisporangium ochraceum]